MSEDDSTIAQKKEELKQKWSEKQAAEQAELETAQKIDSLLRQVLEPEAKQRLSNVRLVNPELYLKATQAILYLVQNNQFKSKISEQQLKQILEKLSQKRETTIKRK